MKPNWLKQIVRTLPGVLVLYAFAPGHALAMCSSTSSGTTATVTCNQTTDLVIVSQSSGLWYHTGAAIGTGPYDWDWIAGEQSIASGGTIEVTFSAGGGKLRVGNDVTPADALIGTVRIGNSIVAGTQAFLDALASTSASTYMIDDGSGLTKVNQLNFYDDASQGLELVVLTGSVADTVNILSIFYNDTFTTDGNGGGEHVNIGNAGSVQSILGPIMIVNNDDLTAITIDDHADTRSRVADITSTGVSGIAPALINWNEYGIGPVVLNTGTGSDRVNVLSIANPFGATSLTIDNAAGSDAIVIGNAGDVQGIEAPVAIESDQLTEVHIADSANSTGRHVRYWSGGVSGMAPGAITWSGAGTYWVSVSLGSGNDIVHVLGSPGDSSGVFQTYMDLGDGNNQCYVTGSGLGPQSNNAFRSGSGDDLFVVSAVPTSVNNVNIYATSQSIADELVYTGGTATGAIPGSGTLVPTDPTAHPIGYGSIELFSINEVIFLDGFE